MTNQKQTLFLSRLPENSNNALIQCILSTYGAIDKVKLKMIKNGRSCAGYGFVELANETVAQNILDQASSIRVCGRPIKVEVNIRGATLKAYKTELDLRKIYIIGIP
jgi:RNA recognition motif-containing protein